MDMPAAHRLRERNALTVTVQHPRSPFRQSSRATRNANHNGQTNYIGDEDIHIAPQYRRHERG